MYWTLELASKLEDAPWPATKDELIDYAVRSGAPLEVLENLQEIEDEGDLRIYRRYLARLPVERRFLLQRGRVLIAFGLVKQLNINAINKCNLFVALVFYGA